MKHSKKIEGFGRKVDIPFLLVSALVMPLIVVLWTVWVGNLRGAEGKKVSKSANPVPFVRLRLPPTELEKYPIKETEVKDFPIKTSRFYEDVEFAGCHIKIREQGLCEESAKAYLPLEDGRVWKYRKEVWARWGLLHEEKKIRRVGAPCWQAFFPYTLEKKRRFVEFRGTEYPVIDIVDIDKSFRGKYGNIYEETFILEKPITHKGVQYFPVRFESKSGKSIRDGRYSHSYKTLWYRDEKDGMVVFKEAISYRISWLVQSQSVRIEEQCLRPIVFDAGYSMVLLYKSPKNEIRRGSIVAVEKEVISVPAGKFKNCLRHVEYLLERDTEELIRPTDFPDNIMDKGWYTISWFSPNVGLVKEIQFDRSGQRCYVLELIETSRP